MPQKFQPKWFGPFRIGRAFPNSTYKLLNSNDAPLPVRYHEHATLMIPTEPTEPPGEPSKPSSPMRATSNRSSMLPISQTVDQDRPLSNSVTTDRPFVAENGIPVVIPATRRSQ
ncbi:hypothetical protein COEREDRAFT_11919 [Coemansia reversa NRRL 1564]|uniref:Uncharacterized protein n=1 Tax=Coemansia reversa (strain ATCC 12441 / NRRL 1564) TaxID=763665 RepID=A0A2G5B1U0_COERN|nr:hypothetical protein COEREDRAFT_11919 [Coemansia reversa NRRL 1564]|eukprot:PIA12979.1 hypothetical protein COEREDRAFT_11919 [Coemansia reversa NRRL 1564]